MITRLVTAFLVVCAVVISGEQPQPARKQEGNTQPQSNQTPADVSSVNPPTTVYNVTQAPVEPQQTEANQSGWNKFVDSLYDPIAWITFALLVMAWLDWRIYRGEIQDNRAIERAYISISQNRPFGGKHRTGYARKYEPSVDQESTKLDRNNLPYFMRSGYNYDRTRGSGEGNDWNDKT